MKKLIYGLIASICSSTLIAQTYVERVFVLNEGYYDYFSGEILTPVTLGAYYPESSEYIQLDEIENARFASDIAVDDTHYYVAADNYLLKYDLFTDVLIQSIEIPGIRKIAINENFIVVTRGEYLVSFEAYVLVFNKNTFAPAFEISNTDLNYSTEGVVIKDGIAYVAVNNGFEFGAEVGYIAEIDLTTQNIIQLIDLGPDGINPDNLMINGDDIFTLNNKDFTGSSVSSYRITTGDLVTTDLINISSGCGTSAFVQGNIYYQEMFGTTLSIFDPISTTTISETEFGMSFYGLEYDVINNLLYTSETDYFSYGKVNIFNADGTIVHSFDVNVSPGNFAFDVRVGTSIQTAETNVVAVYPNPTESQMIISSESSLLEIRVTALNGQIMDVYSDIHSTEFILDMQKYNSGNYLISVIATNSASTTLIIKL